MWMYWIAQKESYPSDSCLKLPAKNKHMHVVWHKFKFVRVFLTVCIKPQQSPQ